jgi:hypothetical protein
MIGHARGPIVSKALVVVATAVMGGSYALDSAHHLRATRETPSAVVPVDERPKLLAYVKGQRPISRSLPTRLAVGDVLPDSGLLYYDIPMSYGLWPLRFTVVDGETVIVDPATSRAVDVVD